MDHKLNIIILAGGIGKRMQNTELPKVLHIVDGLPMIVRLLYAVQNINHRKIIVIVGRFKDIIETTNNKYIDIDIEYVIQPLPLGTGHAILCALTALDDNTINLIINGDNPMISCQTLRSVLYNFKNNDSPLQITAINTTNPCGSGRIISNNNTFRKIIEEKDCDDTQRTITLVNCGIYVASIAILKTYIPQIENDNLQNEYYLTDIVEIAKSNSINVGLLIIDSNKSLEVININTSEQLDNLNKLLIHK